MNLHASRTKLPMSPSVYVGVFTDKHTFILFLVQVQTQFLES